MKLMIASDIHGSAFYCKQLIEAYKQEQPDKLLLLGDLLITAQEMTFLKITHQTSHRNAKRYQRPIDLC